MSKYENIIVAAVFTIFLAGMGLTLYFSQKKDESAIGVQQFRARPGTQLDTAQALLSRRQDSAPSAEDGEGVLNVQGDASSSAPATARMGTGPGNGPGSPGTLPLPGYEETREVVSAAKLYADEASSSLDPDEGLTRLKAKLAAEDNLGAASAMYVAMGKLYARKSPPEIEQAFEAFATAKQVSIPRHSRGL